MRTQGIRHWIAALAMIVGFGNWSAIGQDKQSIDFSRVDRRIEAWQPTKDERRFDEIGWVEDIRMALKLGKENQRPVFLFTHKGRMNVGRC
jgi:hypothetical protein